MSTHREAIDRAVRAAGRRLTVADEPLVELARTLADQMDACGPAGPGTRLAGTYLTTVRTLQQRIGVLSKASGGSKLSQLRLAAGGDT